MTTGKILSFVCFLCAMINIGTVYVNIGRRQFLLAGYGIIFAGGGLVLSFLWWPR